MEVPTLPQGNSESDCLNSSCFKYKKIEGHQHVEERG